MSDHNPSPVSLPAGGYDYDDLKKGLETASKAKAEVRDDAVSKALDKAASESPFKPGDRDPAFQTGFRPAEVKNEALGVTETIQVFDSALVEDVKEEAAAIPPANKSAPSRPASAVGAATSKE